MKRQVYPGAPERSYLWILAVLPVVIIPFENHESLSLGISISKLTIIPLLLGVLLYKSRHFFSMWKHPVLLTGILFLAWGSFIELLHPLTDLQLHYRILQMFIFSALIATTATSNQTVFARIVTAQALVCSILAVYLIYNFYGSISSDVTTSREASRIRGLTFNEMSLGTNLNEVAYTVGMGAIISLARFLQANRNKARFFWGINFILCSLGSIVPLSRGAFFALLLSSATVLRQNLKKLLGLRMLILTLGVVVLLFSLIPEALTQRLGAVLPGAEDNSGRVDGRLWLYTNIVRLFPDYWAIGVGSGHFWQQWGWENGFNGLGPHNGFFSAWIYFGLPGILLLCLICFFAAVHCPRQDDRFPETSSVLGLLVLGSVWLMFTHVLYMKSFGVVLGLLIAASKKVPGTIQKPLFIRRFAGPHRRNVCRSACTRFF